MTKVDVKLENGKHYFVSFLKPIYKENSSTPEVKMVTQRAEFVKDRRVKYFKLYRSHEVVNLEEVLKVQPCDRRGR